MKTISFDQHIPQYLHELLVWSRHLVNIIQIEIDFLYDSLSATAGYLFPKEDLGQESSNRMSKICHMETINK